VMEDRLAMVMEEEHTRLMLKMVVIDDGRQRDDAHCEQIGHQFSSLSVITAFLLLLPPPPPAAPDAAAAAAGHGMLGQVH
jgi:hypothetical protein